MDSKIFKLWENTRDLRKNITVEPESNLLDVLKVQELWNISFLIYQIKEVD